MSTHSGSVMAMSSTLEGDAQSKSNGKVRALSAHLPFVEVDGSELKAWLAEPESGRAEMKKLLSRHGLVVFRSAELSPSEEVQAAKLAGYHANTDPLGLGILGGWNSMPVGLANLLGQPEVLCQGNVKLENHYGVSTQLTQLLTYDNEGFHSDGIHNMQERCACRSGAHEATPSSHHRRYHLPPLCPVPRPLWRKCAVVATPPPSMTLTVAVRVALAPRNPVLTSMYCIKAPLAGGETFFTCTRLALASIADPALRDLCRRRERQPLHLRPPAPHAHARTLYRSARTIPPPTRGPCA